MKAPALTVRMRRFSLSAPGHVRCADSRAEPGSRDELQAMRTVIQGIDVRNPTSPTIEIIALHALKPASTMPRLHSYVIDFRQALFKSAALVAAYGGAPWTTAARNAQSSCEFFGRCALD